MRISTKGRYGLRAMLDLAVNSNGEKVSLFSIAKRQDISVNYLEQVFSVLRKAGYVNSIKGASGGYLLAMDPSKIKVGDILRSLEGDLVVVDEITDSGQSSNNIQLCIKKNVWDKFNESIAKAADSITLRDLVENYRDLTSSPMFYI
ncbi:MAG TPA: Rrf2 family transcriptional regulator [Ruminiclostridium sp.]|nr:Rrf2 family transcriptional regulator [Ruminiclostridium sp.]